MRFATINAARGSSAGSVNENAPARSRLAVCCHVSTDVSGPSPTFAPNAFSMSTQNRIMLRAYAVQSTY